MLNSGVKWVKVQNKHIQSFIEMAPDDNCSALGCSNNLRYLEKQVVLPLVGILRFELQSGYDRNDLI